MNPKVNKLLSFLTLQPRTNALNCFIGYVNLLNFVDEEITWDHVIDYIINIDKAVLDIFEKDINKDLLKQYGVIFNDCYNFINEEEPISFIKEAAFNNVRVANIQDYTAYLVARRLLLNEYEKDKGVS
jgi:hypothetical protein